MKVDASIKAMLTVIAVMLSAIVVKPLISPTIVADAQAQRTQSASMPKASPEGARVVWEYKSIDLSRRGGFGLQDYSDMFEDGRRIPGTDWLGRAGELGAQGWELVSVMPASNLSGQNFAGATSEIMFVFKRQAH